MKRITHPLSALLAILATVLIPYAALAAQTELTWLGHSAFRITTPSGKILLIDPWINRNNTDAVATLAGLDKVDYIFLTHTHIDHVGDTVDLAKKTGAKLVATFEVRQAMVTMGGYPPTQAPIEGTGHFGGKTKLLGGEVTVGFVPAVHGSGMDAVEGAPVPAKTLYYGGSPGGFWISIKNGPTFYHTGDTDVFGDMALVNLFGPVDMMLVPIGDKFTMGPERAAYAAKLVGPKMAAPMHYGSLPVFTGTPAAFEQALAKTAPSVSMVLLKIGRPMGFKSRPEIVAPPYE